MSGNPTELSRKTGRGLPVVTQDTIHGLFQSDETGSQPWGKRLEEVKARLIKEQPALVKFLEEQVSKYPPQLHNAFFEVAVGIYSILEQQSQANNLASSFTVSSEKE